MLDEGRAYEQGLEDAEKGFNATIGKLEQEVERLREWVDNEIYGGDMLPADYVKHREKGVDLLKGGE